MLEGPLGAYGRGLLGLPSSPNKDIPLAVLIGAPTHQAPTMASNHDPILDLDELTVASASGFLWLAVVVTVHESLVVKNSSKWNAKLAIGLVIRKNLLPDKWTAQKLSIPHYHPGALPDAEDDTNDGCQAVDCCEYPAGRLL